MTHKVFVYGTLKRGHYNDRYLQTSRFCGTDRIGGVMYSLGSFPAVHLDATGEVHGEVFEVDDATLERLDRLEGTPHFYQRTRVRMASGQSAWIYLMDEEKIGNRGRGRITSGRWEQRE